MERLKNCVPDPTVSVKADKVREFVTDEFSITIFFKEGSVITTPIIAKLSRW